MAEKRVIEQVASNEVHNDDWFLKDSPTQDTSKISATNLKAILGADGTLALEEIANAIAEEYNPSATYNKGAYVFYEGAFYKCTQNSTTGTWDSSKWNITSVINLINSNAGDITELEYKSNNAIAMNHSTIATYNKGDYVFYWFHLYRCLEDDVYGAWDDSKWEEVNILEYIDYVLENAGQVQDVTVDGTSVVTNKVAEIEIPVKDVQVKTDSTYDSVVDASGNAKIDLSGKANTSGYYEDFIAGTAENLMADNYTEDKVPYNFRQSFNGARLEDEIVGGTVAWNQVITFSQGSSTISGVTYTRTNDGKVTANNEATSLSYLNLGVDYNAPSHVIYFCGCPSNSKGIYVKNGYGTAQEKTDTGNGAIVRINQKMLYQIIVPNGVNPENMLFIPQVFDLTQMFGSTIADYIYSLEQATAGAGIAYFRNLFPKSYYAYNAGTLMSVNTSSHDTVGFNQWDEEWEKGSITDNGVYVNTDTIRSKNFNRVKPNTEYYISNPNGALSSQFRACFFDENKTFISRTPNTVNTFTTPSNCHYFKLTGANAYGATYHNDICVNISDASKNGTYEPYIKHTYPLDSDLTLRGIPKLDANNNLYYDGDVYESDGSVTRRYGVVDLGTLDWSYYNGVFYANIPGKAYKNTTKDCFCAKYVVAETNAVNVNDASTIMADKQLCGFRRSSGTSENSYIYAEDSAYTDAQAFTTAMNGVYLVYELATPTTESADAFATPQIVSPKGTEEYVDYVESQGTRDVAIPVGHNSKYHADLKAKIENIPDVPSANGTYTLKATRSASGVTYSWVSG